MHPFTTSMKKKMIALAFILHDLQAGPIEFGLKTGRSLQSSPIDFGLT